MEAMLRQKQTLFMFKLKKARKTIRTFSYDLNQIPYDFIVQVTKRFKRLDLVHRVPEELRNRGL